VRRYGGSLIVFSGGGGGGKSCECWFWARGGLNAHPPTYCSKGLTILVARRSRDGGLLIGGALGCWNGNTPKLFFLAHS